MHNGRDEVTLTLSKKATLVLVTAADIQLDQDIEIAESRACHRSFER